MKMMRWIFMTLLATALVGAVAGWKKVEQLRAENGALLAELGNLREQRAAAAEAEASQRAQGLERSRSEIQEVLRLRNEVTRLRSEATGIGQLRVENQRLREENRQLSASSASSTAPAPASATSAPPSAGDQFPKESWAFSGYTTPEAALVSAVWAMREGNPKVYLESLTAEEQERIAKTWENKSEEEIAAKHQQDVSSITGVRILERQLASADEVLMNVYVEGANRMEKVSMKRVGDEWKFGGFIRNPPK